MQEFIAIQLAVIELQQHTSTKMIVFCACNLRHKNLALRSNLIQRAEYYGEASLTIISISLMQEFIAIQLAVIELQHHTSTKMIVWVSLHALARALSAAQPMSIPK